MILVVDNEPSVRMTLTMLLKGRGHPVQEAGDGRSALDFLRSEAVDLVITDLKMPEVSGLDVLRETKVLSPETEVILLTGHGTIESAVEAMRLGAFDYVTKPFEPSELLHRVRNALERHRLLREVRHLRQQIREHHGFGTIVGTSLAIQRLAGMVTRVAAADTTVLIEGESGTGKELVARAIHAESPRASHPCVAINCAALPETLLESELFGHVKGAFTGAATAKKGLFEEANQGTLFLDEIGDAPPQIQVKLLRVLQEREIRRVGSTSPIRIDVRLLAATNRRLEELVREGRFREDLYYRLNVVALRLPPLRERREDIPLLAAHFLTRAAKRHGRPVPTLSPEAMALLLEHRWPGNIRELENAIERAVLLAETDTLFPGDLPGSLGGSRGGESGEAAVKPRRLEEVEREHILRTLDAYAWNQARAADALGIGRNTLWRKLKDFGVAPPERHRESD
ncbi:MAG TPA: sigma-54 dependent transcriptional regulator [Candidatus Methylomirabilis sp.]|nr:sigma-54 dependent transcriptional regulator [Candidatus Methylomirabilis sp.]